MKEKKKKKIIIKDPLVFLLYMENMWSILNFYNASWTSLLLRPYGAYVFSLYIQYSSFLLSSCNVSALPIKVITQSCMSLCLSEQ